MEITGFQCLLSKVSSFEEEKKHNKPPLFISENKN